MIQPLCKAKHRQDPNLLITALELNFLFDTFVFWKSTQLLVYVEIHLYVLGTKTDNNKLLN